MELSQSDSIASYADVLCIIWCFTRGSDIKNFVEVLNKAKKVKESLLYSI